jgi:hypothetical protein
MNLIVCLDSRRVKQCNYFVQLKKSVFFVEESSVLGPMR